MKTQMNKITKWLLVFALVTPALAQENSSTEPELRLNFRGAPLELVLDYLSEAAGFTIMLETSISGTVDVWSNRPLTRDEAIDVLNSALNSNGYAAIRDGKKLTIVTKDEAKKRNIPVKSGYDPASIPKNDEIVTQILPVRYINATQLTTDLQPLLPDTATMTANEGGNALVITDTQANIRRIAEIIAALDTTVASVATVKVFPLRYADSKALAETISNLFKEASSTGNGDNNGRGGRGGFPGFGRGGRGDDDESNGSSTGLQAATKVTAVADEHSNSIIVAAPEEYLPMIADLIANVDTVVQDVTELRVFILRNADPVEMAELLTNLFPDETSTSDNNRGPGFRFGGGGPFGRGGNDGNGTSSTGSDRAKRQSRVMAVADARTSSIVVSASNDQMDQIAAMITQLDSNSSRKQKVFVYSLENADSQEVETILRGLFEGENTRNAQTGNQQNNALTTRANNAAQTQGQNTSGFGTNARGGNNGGFQ